MCFKQEKLSMIDDIKCQQTQERHALTAEMEQSLNRKLPYARPIITELNLGTEDVSNNNGNGSDGGIPMINHS